jgi:hypothetical protein
LKQGLADFPTSSDKDVVYSFLAKYVRKTHSDCEIKRELKNNEGMSFVDMITPSDIAFVISIIKNSRHVWDQTMKMTSTAFNANVENEKKLRPLFTEGTGKKKEQGKSLWSAKGMKYFKRAERKWKKIYQNETIMIELYSGFAAWLNKYGRTIIVAKNSTKSLHSVLATRMVKKMNKHVDDKSTDSERENESDEEEEDGYCSDKGSNRLSMTWSKEEMEREITADNDMRRNNNKRSGDSIDNSDGNNLDENDIDDNVERIGSLTSSEKRQKLGGRANEVDIGMIRRNTAKERVRR